MKLKVIKELNQDNSFAPRTIKEGEILYEYGGCTYGCISRKGMAACFEEMTTPFFEVPLTHIQKDA